MAQCVRGSRIVLLDRMRRKVLDEPGVVEKFGVAPDSIPDWLALVEVGRGGPVGLPASRRHSRA